MTGTATRYLYLVRHGEASPDESGLTRVGRRQATLLGQRLRDVPFAALHHGPLPRSEQTARLIGDQVKNVPVHVAEVAGDYGDPLYEPETIAFGGADGMTIAHALFPTDSVGVLDYLQHATSGTTGLDAKAMRGPASSACPGVLGVFEPAVDVGLEVESVGGDAEVCAGTLGA
ncbi:histidine phosphatase family protein [Streptomyces sp. NPDC048483]|uniref:histidine phosphatase family protein n=1 Tax=Streptomyces sp. NPDC048483 TaxID=3154927 RepID=UPI003429ED53